jgi:hypothetical protein
MLRQARKVGLFQKNALRELEAKTGKVVITSAPAAIKKNF